MPGQRHSQPTVCLGVSCHLHFWQNDRGLLRATAVTRGWSGHRTSQHTKLTLEKNILPPLLPGFEPVTFRSRAWRSNQRAIPAPKTNYRCRHHQGTRSCSPLLDLLTFCYITGKKIVAICRRFCRKWVQRGEILINSEWLHCNDEIISS